MAKTNVRGSQIADGANGVDLTVDVTGVLPVANGGTGVANPTASRFLVGNGTSVIDLSKIVPSGTVVGTSDTQTLTAKTLTTPLLSQVATPSAPAASNNEIYSKSDGNLYQQAPDGVERLVEDAHPVRVVAVGSITLSGTQTIDGVAVVALDRVLCIAQGVFSGTGPTNGIYVVNAGAWTRAGDANTTAQMVGLKVRPTEGRYAGKTLSSTMKATDTLGTSTLSFTVNEGIPHGSVFEQPYTNKAGETFYDAQNQLLQINNGSALISIVPAGLVVEYGGFTAPTGWLLANAQAVSRTSFTALFAALTYAFTGSGASGQKVITTTDTTNAKVGMIVDGTGVVGNTIASIVAGTSITMASNLTVTLSSTTIRLAPHGDGDGSTTFNVPNRSGKVAVGVDGTTEFLRIGQTGGDKNLQQHGHALAQAMHLSNAESAGFGLAASSSFTNRVVVGGAPANTEPALAGTGTSQNLQPYAVTNYVVKT